jgi:hypothetical protein
MTSLNYTEKMNDLRKRVSQFTELPYKSYTTSSSSKNLYFYFFYLIPPIIIIIILALLRPSFILYTNIDKNNVEIKKINYKNLILTGLICGFLIDIGFFAYFKKKI